MTGERAIFSIMETGLLLNLIDKYRPIIECKITNTFHNQKKSDAWLSLQKDFNKANGVSFRTVEQLKNKYKNMKKKPPQKKSDEIELLPSGGGIQTVKPTSLDENHGSSALCNINIKIEPSENVQDFVSENVNENLQGSEKDSPAQTGYNNDEMTVGVDTNEISTVNENEEEPEEDLEHEYISPSHSIRNIDKRHWVLVKRKWNLNASKKAAEALTKRSKARKLAVETESDQIKRIREAEHQFKKEEHALRMKVLESKLNYYNSLSAKLDSETIIFEKIK